MYVMLGVGCVVGDCSVVMVVVGDAGRRKDGCDFGGECSSSNIYGNGVTGE